MTISVLVAAYKPAKGRDTMAGVLSALGTALNICTRLKVTFMSAPSAGFESGQIAAAAPGLRVLMLQNLLDDLHPPQAKIPPGSPDPALERAQAAWRTLEGVCELVRAAAATEALQATFAEQLKPKAAGPSATTTSRQDAAPPLQVEIVGMPERITSTTVTRDSSGEIAETQQVETDALSN